MAQRQRWRTAPTRWPQACSMALLSHHSECVCLRCSCCHSECSKSWATQQNLSHLASSHRTLRACPSNINPNCVATASINDVRWLGSCESSLQLACAHAAAMLPHFAHTHTHTHHADVRPCMESKPNGSVACSSGAWLCVEPADSLRTHAVEHKLACKRVTVTMLMTITWPLPIHTYTTTPTPTHATRHTHHTQAGAGGHGGRPVW